MSRMDFLNDDGLIPCSQVTEKKYRDFSDISDGDDEDLVASCVSAEETLSNVNDKQPVKAFQSKCNFKIVLPKYHKCLSLLNRTRNLNLLILSSFCGYHLTGKTSRTTEFIIKRYRIAYLGRNPEIDAARG